MSNTKNRLLTILIPFYNTPLELFWRCLRSIPNDDRIKVEVYDDGSQDKYAACDYIRWLAESDDMKWLDNCSKCNLTVLSENIGLGAVRNLGIKSCNTKYIMFLDSDDTINSQALIDTLDFIESEKIEYSVICRSIKLICGDSENVEHIDKFIKQRMIPYFVTPNIYDTCILRDNDIYFDESRRVFEDIMFSVKLWTYLLCDAKTIDNRHSVLYNYYLDSPSLTRVKYEKLARLHDDLMYWVNWIKEYYNGLSESKKEIMKVYLFNRIRYEVEKAMECRMKLDGAYVYDEFKVYLDQLKPYRIDKVLKS